MTDRKLTDHHSIKESLNYAIPQQNATPSVAGFTQINGRLAISRSCHISLTPTSTLLSSLATTTPSSRTWSAGQPPNWP